MINTLGGYPESIAQFRLIDCILDKSALGMQWQWQRQLQLLGRES